MRVQLINKDSRRAPLPAIFNMVDWGGLFQYSHVGGEVASAACRGQGPARARPGLDARPLPARPSDEVLARGGAGGAQPWEGSGIPPGR